MIQKDKELLLCDLCARLPYGVYVLVHDTFEYSTVPYENVYLKSSDISSLIDSISLNEKYNSKDKRFNRIIKERKDFLEFKPYLRPMSSMTKEEKEELLNLLFDKESKNFYIDEEGFIDGKTSDLMKDGLNYPSFCPINIVLYTDWFNAHHFDYRGLIEKGLAIEATKENTPYV